MSRLCSRLAHVTVLVLALLSLGACTEEEGVGNKPVEKHSIGAVPQA